MGGQLENLAIGDAELVVDEVDAHDQLGDRMLDLDARVHLEKSELTAFVEQVAINQASVHTSCSQYLADEVAAVMNVRKPIRVIPNGIDVPMFDHDDGIDAHDRFGIPRDGITIFFANRIGPLTTWYTTRFDRANRRFDATLQIGDDLVGRFDSTYGFLQEHLVDFVAQFDGELPGGESVH